MISFPSAGRVARLDHRRSSSPHPKLSSRHWLPGPTVLSAQWSAEAECALPAAGKDANVVRSEEHTSELQSLMRISYAVFCLKKKKTQPHNSISSMKLIISQ